MAVSTIPLLDVARQSMVLRLGGVDVRLTVWWQPGDAVWYASLEIPAGTPTVTGRRLVLDGDLLAGRQAVIPGGLFCRAINDSTAEPVFGAWGVTHAIRHET